MRPDDVIKISDMYHGASEGGAKHKEIIDTYNSHKPLARNYKVTYKDAWCMTYISFLFIKGNGVDALGKTECGCQEYLNYARKQGMEVKTPQRGDLVFYDWENDGHVDHVGLVTLVSGKTLFIDEGNKSDMVATITISVDHSSIKAFIRPKYNSQSTTYDMSKVSFADSFDRNIAGEYECTASDFVALRYNPYVNDGKNSNKIDEIKHGEHCHCYGYYTGDWYLVVYKGKTGFANKMWLKKGVK